MILKSCRIITILHLSCCNLRKHTENREVQLCVQSISQPSIPMTFNTDQRQYRILLSLLAILWLTAAWPVDCCCGSTQPVQPKASGCSHCGQSSPEQAPPTGASVHYCGCQHNSTVSDGEATPALSFNGDSKLQPLPIEIPSVASKFDLPLTPFTSSTTSSGSPESLFPGWTPPLRN